MGAGTWESHHAISILLFRYAECVDLADFDGLSELFAHGTLGSTSAADPSEPMAGDRIGRFYAATNKVHGDGTLRTRHLSTNVMIDIDEGADSATSRSYFVVFQATDDLAFQPIVGGRYQDRFARLDGAWHFAERIVHVDQIGDLHEHLTFDLAAGDIRFDDVVEG